MSFTLPAEVEMPDIPRDAARPRVEFSRTDSNDGDSLELPLADRNRDDLLFIG
jgi:hypothetical protein